MGLIVRIVIGGITIAGYKVCVDCFIWYKNTRHVQTQTADEDHNI